MVTNPSRSTIRFVLRLLNQLMNGEKKTVSEVLKESPFKDAAIRRCLDLLEKEIPLIELEGKRPKRWAFKWPTEKTVEPFTVLALRLAQIMLTFLRGSELDARLEDVITDHTIRISSTNYIPPDISRMFFAKTRFFEPMGIESNVIDQIVQCIIEQKCILATYTHFNGEPDEVTIDPYSLIYADEGLYLYGKCTNSGKTSHIATCRLYHTGRFQQFKRLEKSFQYPVRDVYDPEKLFQNCFGIFLPSDKEATPEDVICRFSPKWKHYLHNHKWHKSQTVPKETGEGHLEVQFKLHITSDLARWLRGFGSEITVVAPTRLEKWVSTGEDPEYSKQ